MRKLVALFALLVGLTAPAAAWAQTSLAVLGLEAVDTPEDVASQVTQALRQRAVARQFRVLAAKPLVELKLVFGCFDEAPACMAPIGASVGAERLIFGAVRKSRTGYAVTLKFFDVGKQKIENELTFQLAKADVTPNGLRQAADAWLPALTGVQSTGTLRVTSNVAEAKVFVDDRAVGSASPGEPLTVSDLETGKHVVRVEAKHYTRFNATVRLGAGETVEVRAGLEHEDSLGPTPQPPAGTLTPEPLIPKPEPESPGRVSRIAFWSTAGAALVGFAVAGYAAYKVSDLESQKNAQMEKACESKDLFPHLCLEYNPACTNNAGDCKSAILEVGNDACRGAKQAYPGRGAPRNATVASLCDQGQSWATATWALFPIAGAFTAASLYFLWTGYISVPSGERERPTTTAQRFRLAPVIGPGVGAFTAEYRF